MTRDELETELPLLFAFAKIVLLDREAAQIRMRRWLRGQCTHRLIGWTTRMEAYRDLMKGCAVDRPPCRMDDLDDPLQSSLLQTLTAQQRAQAFLAGPARFAPDIAETIVESLRLTKASPFRPPTLPGLGLA